MCAQCTGTLRYLCKMGLYKGRSGWGYTKEGVGGVIQRKEWVGLYKGRVIQRKEWVGSYIEKGVGGVIYRERSGWGHI